MKSTRIGRSVAAVAAAGLLALSANSVASAGTSTSLSFSVTSALPGSTFTATVTCTPESNAADVYFVPVEGDTVFGESTALGIASGPLDIFIPEDADPGLYDAFLDCFDETGTVSGTAESEFTVEGPTATTVVTGSTPVTTAPAGTANAGAARPVEAVATFTG